MIVLNAFLIARTGDVISVGADWPLVTMEDSRNEARGKSSILVLAVREGLIAFAIFIPHTLAAIEKKAGCTLGPLGLGMTRHALHSLGRKGRNAVKKIPGLEQASALSLAQPWGDRWDL